MDIINENLFPPKERICSWIDDLCQWGHRKTGTPEGRKSAEYIAAKFREFGLEDVKIEEAGTLGMNMEEYSLNIDGEDIECFYANGTNKGAETGTFEMGMNGEEYEFVYLKAGTDKDFEGIDVSGKIVICDILFQDMNIEQLAEMYEESEIYDPYGEIDVPGVKKNIYSPCSWPYNYYNAMAGGAAGFVGILKDYYDDPYWYNEDYEGIANPAGVKYMSLPSLWISRTTGEALKEKLTHKKLMGNMRMKTTYEYKTALNVCGKLPGKSPDIILTHSHHDAVFQGAVQDASGIATMLSLAEYFSKIPADKREKTMMFAATDTHYTDYNGHMEFIIERQRLGENLLIDLAIEHIGEDVYFDDAYNECKAGGVEPRLAYVTEVPGLWEIVREVFKKHGMTKTLFAKVTSGTAKPGSEAFDEYEYSDAEVISDACCFHATGTPVVSIVSSPMYLYHPSDTPARIVPEYMEKTGKVYAEIAQRVSEIL